ncbi:unnamed protein product [Bodo saltans]|uniref:Uncharacterized protein n=1 Tax=Bodo saltans TaxID=75058 RepID=A0A0S4IU46_BODSA|nr:unnamed protein product [Bodo saltans]|eukprot:CUF86811.1 unnamed protein product [Bodo saltans]
MNQMRHELEQLRQLKEEPHEQLTQSLKREHEGKREQLLSMQSVSAKQQELELELQRHVDMSGELRHNSKYQMAFRVTFARRVERGCQSLLERQDRELEALRSDIRDAEKGLQGVVGKRSAAAKNESDAKTLFRAREKELEALRSRGSALEWRKRTLMKQDEQLRLAAERKLNLKPTIALVTKVLAAFNLLTHSRLYTAAVDAADESNRNQTGQIEAAASLRHHKHNSLIEDAKEEIDRLAIESSTARDRLLSTQQAFSNRIQRLHAECIFLETEIKEITELQEKGTASLGKAKAAAFFASKEDATSKLQSSSQQLKQRVLHLVAELEAQLADCIASEEKSLSRVQQETQDAEIRVAEATAFTAEQFNKSQSAENERIEALNRESFSFLSHSRQLEQRYRPPQQIFHLVVVNLKKSSLESKFFGSPLESSRFVAPFVLQRIKKLLAHARNEARLLVAAHHRVRLAAPCLSVREQRSVEPRPHVSHCWKAHTLHDLLLVNKLAWCIGVF